MSQKERASHLMKLLYGSRTDWPPIAVAISRVDDNQMECGMRPPYGEADGLRA